MSQDKLDCYILPGTPLPLLLPVECVADVLAEPEIDPLEDARANWMRGHVNWRNQRLAVISFSALQDDRLNETNKEDPLLVVLNPIPSAARKVYSALLCYGQAQQLSVDTSISTAELTDSIDKRYVESVVRVDESDFIVPKLSALGVAFSYF